MSRALSWRWSLAVLGLFLLKCSLTSSLDDLKSNADRDAGHDAASGGTGAQGGTGGTSGTGASGGTGGTSGAGGTSGTGASGGTGGTGTGGTGGQVDPCVDAGDCAQCCTTSHSAGATAFVNAIKKCVCAGGSSCLSACSGYCSGGQIDMTCSTCVNSAAIQQCLSGECQSADCKVYLACVGSC